MSHGRHKHDQGLRQLIADRIMLYRNAAEITQGTLAALSGVDQSYISEIERGLATPGAGVIVALCAALECEPNDLLLP